MQTLSYAMVGHLKKSFRVDFVDWWSHGLAGSTDLRPRCYAGLSSARGHKSFIFPHGMNVESCRTLMLKATS